MKAPLISRRSVIAGGVGVVVLLGLGGVGSYTWAGDRKLLRPPGGQDEAHLVGACIRCDRCRQACPMHAIESGELEDGLVNIRTPKMNFRGRTLERTLGATEYHEVDTGYCNFCDPDQTGHAKKRCVANCPTGALKDFDEQEEWLGKATINPVYCISFPQIGQSPTGCRLCVDACDYGAIVLNDERRPEVIQSRCNGCGKCELVCPSATYRQFISIGRLEEGAAAGLSHYEESLAYHRSTGKMPRGINVG